MQYNNNGIDRLFGVFSSIIVAIEEGELNPIQALVLDRFYSELEADMSTLRDLQYSYFTFKSLMSEAIEAGNPDPDYGAFLAYELKRDQKVFDDLVNKYNPFFS